MNRKEIAKILKRNHGCKSELARRAGVGATAISAWLRGGVSRNISDKAEILARELLRKEEAERIARGEANGHSARKVVDQIRRAASQTEEK